MKDREEPEEVRRGCDRHAIQLRPIISTTAPSHIEAHTALHALRDPRQDLRVAHHIDFAS